MKTHTHQTAQTEWDIKPDPKNEQYKLLKKNAIRTSEGVEDQWVASIYDLEDFNSFIRELLQSHEKQTAEDICKLIDDIEDDYSNSSMDVWKLFKRIRNRIRDTYDPEGFQKDVGEK